LETGIRADSLRYVAVSKLPVDDSNMDREPAIEQRHSKPLSLKNFLTPESISTPHAGQTFSKKQGVTPAIAMQFVQIGAKKRMAAPK
jgi:hypothetical protein